MDVGEDLHHFGSAAGLGEEGAGNGDNLLADRRQAFEGFLFADVAEQQHGLLAAVAHQVAQGDDSHQLAAVDDGQVLDAVAGHVRHGLVHVGIGRQRMRDEGS